MEDFVDVCVHCSKDEKTVLKELVSLDEQISQNMVIALYITIVGYNVDLSRKLCNQLIKRMINFVSGGSKKKKLYLRMLRVNQDAYWSKSFLSRVQCEAIPFSHVDIETHASLSHQLLSFLGSLLTRNCLKHLRIESGSNGSCSVSDFELSNPKSKTGRLSEYLRGNKSLESLLIDSFFSEVDDSSLIYSLRSKPNLKILQIREPDCRMSVDALQCILSDQGCAIENLTIIESFQSIHSSTSSKPTEFLFKLSKPNRSVKQFYHFGSRGMVASDFCCILESFLVLEKCIIPRARVSCLPSLSLFWFKQQAHLNVLDLSGSHLVKSWESFSVNASKAMCIFNSLVKYRMTFPNLKIRGFSSDHPVMSEFPKFISRQRKISASLWPIVLDLISMFEFTNQSENENQSNLVMATKYSILHHYISHEACGLTPNF